jgi:hypothetical protein
MPAGKTRVVNCSRHRADVMIDRTTDLGNPFILGHDGSREAVLAKFEAYARQRLATDPAYRAAVEALRGKRLGCWCKPKACHGDIYAAMLAEGITKPDNDS